MKNQSIIDSLFSDFIAEDSQDCEDVFLSWLVNLEIEKKFIFALEEMRDSVRSRINMSVKMVDDGFNGDEVWENIW